MSALSAPYRKLVEYFQRCQNTALELPARRDVVQYWSGIGFMLDGRRYVAPLEEVSEIMTLPSYTRVPGVANWMKGVANVRGRLMAVMDLIGFLDKRTDLKDARRRLLVLDHGDIYTGITVDDVFGMQHFDMGTFNAAPEQVDESVQEYVKGVYLRDGEPWQVFSITALAEDPRFLQVAQAS